jgi:hypothetical protein
MLLAACGMGMAGDGGPAAAMPDPAAPSAAGAAMPAGSSTTEDPIRRGGPERPGTVSGDEHAHAVGRLVTDRTHAVVRARPRRWDEHRMTGIGPVFFANPLAGRRCQTCSRRGRRQ